MQTILLVEDEEEIREFEKDYLEKEGFKVLEAADGLRALSLFGSSSVDLVVLDLNLPEVNGIDVCKTIREESGIPIIMVTARTKEIDELIGLEVGADDYIKKPFSPRILIARIKTLLKRPQLQDTGTLVRRGDLEFDIPALKLKKGGHTIELTVIQYNILLTLAATPGRIFSRDELLDRGYDTSLPPDIFDRTIDAHIKNIRKVIEADTSRPEYILTVRGRGYKFNEDI